MKVYMIVWQKRPVGESNGDVSLAGAHLGGNFSGLGQCANISLNWIRISFYCTEGKVILFLKTDLCSMYFFGKMHFFVLVDSTMITVI